MSRLFEYPEQARFGRILPKNKIYEHGRPGAAVRKLFVDQVDQIIWLYKLAPETVNIPASSTVQEIQVFSIRLKQPDVSSEVLRCIDESVPFPIVFELTFNGKTRPVAAYKRPSVADPSKWVISCSFYGDWVEDKNDRPERHKLPVVMNLGQLYENLLDTLLPYPARPNEDIQARVERMEIIHNKKREITHCESKLRKEKQFNRKVTINGQLRMIKQDLERLTA